MDTFLIARIMVTAATLIITGAPLLADLNRTHAKNPLWTPHARYHVVWQVLSYGLIGVIGLFLIWTSGPLAVERLYLACALLAAIMISFFTAAATVRWYGGAFYDENGYRPFATKKIFGRTVEFDVNATGFSIFGLILLAAIASVHFGT